ncbi:MAG: hypothetical protein JNM27_21285 [Leptospirales bacterium]|nr:hypothetical protein [Leptospirales bacterium]
MNKRFKTIFPMLLILFSPILGEDARFVPSSLALLAQQDAINLKQFANAPGMHTFNNYLRLEVPVNSHAIDITPDGAMTLNAWAQIGRIDLNTMQQFKKQWQISVQGQKFIFFLPQNLSDALDTVEEGNSVMLWVFNGTLDDFSKEHAMLVLKLATPRKPNQTDAQVSDQPPSHNNK